MGRAAGLKHEEQPWKLEDTCATAEVGRRRTAEDEVDGRGIAELKNWKFGHLENG